MNRFSVSFLGVALLLSSIPLNGRSKNPPNSQAPIQSDSNPFLRALNNGTWWNSISPQQKSDFVDGYITAMASVRRTLLGLFNDSKNQLVASDPQFQVRMDALLNRTTLAEYYDYDLDVMKLVAGVNDFYKDPLNTRIRVELALQHVRDTLNGKNAPKDLENQLNTWRERVNR